MRRKNWHKQKICWKTSIKCCGPSKIYSHSAHHDGCVISVNSFVSCFSEKTFINCFVTKTWNKSVYVVLQNVKDF